MGLSESKQKYLNPIKSNTLGSFQPDGPVLIPRRSQVLVFTVKDGSVSTVRDEQIHRQLRASPGFRGQFRVSKKRLTEIGRKGLEQMERFNRSDIGDIAE